MTLWLRVHHVRAAGLAALVMLVVVGIAGESRVPAPSLLRTALVGTPIALVLPLLACAFLSRSLTAGPTALEAVGTRPARSYTAALAVAVCAVAVLVGGLLTWSGYQPLGFAAARNLTGLSGLAMLGTRWGGHDAATVLPTAYLFLTVLVGLPEGREPPWLWPLTESGDVPSAAVAGALFALGLLVCLRPGGHRTAAP
ncbi:MAG TPA: hypothetical protein VHJ17_22285 [Thermomonospora sp.]|nr:hypothetical protein [Thermomonospora sp.]